MSDQIVQVHMATFDQDLFSQIKRILAAHGVTSEKVFYTSDNKPPTGVDGQAILHLWIAGRRWSNLVPAFKKILAEQGKEANMICIMWEKSPKHVPSEHLIRTQQKEGRAEQTTIQHIKNKHGKDVLVFTTLESFLHAASQTFNTSD